MPHPVPILSRLGRPSTDRFRRWRTILLTLALCGYFAWFGYRRIMLRPDPRPDYWAAKLGAIDPPGAGATDTETGRRILTSRPFEIMDTTVLQEFPIAELLRGKWKSYDANVDLTPYIFNSEAFGGARTELKAALEAGWEEPVSLEPRAVRPSLSPYRDWAMWLLAHARWAHVERRDTALMLEDWAMTLRLARQARRQRTLGAWQAEAAILTLLGEEMIYAMREGVGEIDSRRLADEAARILGSPPRPREILEVERLALQCRLEYVFVRERGDWLDVSELVALRSRSTRRPRRAMRIWNITSLIFHDLPTARGNVERLLNVVDTCRDMGSTNIFFNSPDASDGTALSVLDGALNVVPEDPRQFARTASLVYRGRCVLEGGLATIALEQYRHRNGAYPERLGQLIPDELGSIPVDWGDSEPLRYRRVEDDYLLYSVGANGTDEGGICDPESPGDFNRSRDVVFSRMGRSGAQ